MKKVNVIVFFFLFDNRDIYSENAVMFETWRDKLCEKYDSR